MRSSELVRLSRHGASRVGFVSLVGAGPGDPDLLTVKALLAIREADAIVHDALIPDTVRALFPPTARILPAGKRGGSQESTGQDTINALLVTLASAGMRVVRLKGGDPFVFGRGGEEAEALVVHGIPFEIVPGISASHGASAAALIPLTHRGLSRSCTLIEGHALNLDRIQWDALVALGGTWVFFMAKASARDIAARLVEHGADPALGVAVVENATLPTQTVHAARLATLAAEGYTPRTSGPGLVIAGPTVSLFHELQPLLQPLVAELSLHERALSDLPGLRA